jgi:RND family efflux transporter MFP subunit
MITVMGGWMRRCHPSNSRDIERSRRSLFCLVSTVLLALAVASCSQGNSAPANQTAGDTRTDSVSVVPAAKATRADLTNQISLTGEFQPYQEVDLMAKVSGYVKSVQVDIGDQVRAGQVLATLEIPEMEDDQTRATAAVQAADADVATARDDLRRATASHEIAHLSYTRIEDVNKKEAGLIPKQDIDVVHSRDLESEAQLAMAQSRLRSAEQHSQMSISEQSRVQTLYKYATIVAPFSGVITKRYANVGSMIQAGTASQTQAMPVVRLSQNNLLRLMLPVPESAVPLIHNGQTVQVSVRAIGKNIPGRVTRFSKSVQTSTRTMDTEVDIPNPSFALVPGMYAEVVLRTAQHLNALSVPVDAIERSAGATTAYTVDSSGCIRIAPVTVGIETPKEIEILSGLKEGDTVIVGRHSGLQEGAKVQPKYISISDASGGKGNGG